MSSSPRPCYRCKAAPRHRTVAYCKGCSTKNMREWRASNPVRNRANGSRSDKKRYSADVPKYTKLRRERMDRWVHANPDKARESYRQKWRRMREAAFEKLGGHICVCCGETLRTMLDIDHINNDGKSDRATGHASKMYTSIRRMDNPKTKYQILCSNCNHSKARNGGECEHVTSRRRAIMRPVESLAKMALDNAYLQFCGEV